MQVLQPLKHYYNSSDSKSFPYSEMTSAAATEAVVDKPVGNPRDRVIPKEFVLRKRRSWLSEMMTAENRAELQRAGIWKGLENRDLRPFIFLTLERPEIVRAIADAWVNVKLSMLFGMYTEG